MLTIQLNGGLGNQLFQYALGKSFMDRFDVRYDISHLPKASTKRTCELTYFLTKGDFGIYPRQKNQALIKERKRYHSITDKLHRPSTWYQYHPLKVKDGSYIQGFWQSYKYFDDIKHLLLEDIQPCVSLDSKNQEIIHYMSDCNSVAIHIRKGDFQHKRLSTLHIKGFYWHSNTPLSYYNQAIALIKERLINPKFFIFSNDIQWCKDHFIDESFEYIEHNTGGQSYKDLVLMTHAKHNIICNSTFSWRGAYLNQTSGKIVIAPKKRYDVNISVDDLLLPDWITV